MEKNVTKTSKEHLLACLSSSPSNARIIRATAQMARAFGGKITALYVKTPASDNMSRENRERLDSHIKLAEGLGAKVVTVYGEDISQQIVEFARLSGVTKVVLGRSNMLGGGLLRRQTLTDKIIKAAPSLDVHIIPDTEVKKGSRFYNAFSAVNLPSLAQWGWTILFLFLSTALGFLFHSLSFTEANTITVYMLGVLFTALITKNYICSGVFSLASVLLFNFFFTEPRLSFMAYDSGYPVTFVIMLLVSLIIGTLANRLAANAKLSANAAYRTNIMLETNQLLQKANSEEAIVKTMAEQLVKLLSRNVIVYFANENCLGAPQIFPAENGGEADALLSEKEKDIALCAFQNQQGASESKTACGIYYSLKTGDSVFGVVGIEVNHKGIDPFENSILTSILGEAALTIESLKNAKEKEEIALLAEHENLRANLLRAISHDLRTPLTSISGNAENLLTNFNRMDEETRKKLLSDVNDDAEWLISLVENLLSISRISEGKMNIHLSAQVVDEVIAEALRHVSRRSAEHQISTDFGQELLLADMDARLISQVIINLVDNAVKYTPPGSQVLISAKDKGERIEISVADNGNGIPDAQKKDVFRMFYTGGHAVVDCHRSLGLGLSLCESIAAAHGGELTLKDNQPHGCVFAFTLKKSEVTLIES